jgi:protein-tyrosine-phosphatase
VSQPLDEGAKATFTVLFVCAGNTCRSPFAEAILRRAAEGSLRTAIQVFSAGISAAAGSPVSPHAVLVAKEHGVDLAGRKSTPLTPELVEHADLILVMEPRHREQILSIVPSARERTHVVTDLAPRAGLGEIPDPFGGPLEDYRKHLGELSAVLAEALPRIAEMIEHPAPRRGRDAS